MKLNEGAENSGEFWISATWWPPWKWWCTYFENTQAKVTFVKPSRHQGCFITSIYIRCTTKNAPGSIISRHLSVLLLSRIYYPCLDYAQQFFETSRYLFRLACASDTSPRPYLVLAVDLVDLIRHNLPDIQTEIGFTVYHHRVSSISLCDKISSPASVWAVNIWMLQLRHNLLRALPI